MAVRLLSLPFPQGKPGDLSSSGNFDILLHFLHPKSEESVLRTSHGGCIKRGTATPAGSLPSDLPSATDFAMWLF